jgi:hypothetical protein
LFTAIKRGPCFAADGRAQRLRKLHERFALSRSGEADRHLSGADHLTGFGERLHHHAV